MLTKIIKFIANVLIKIAETIDKYIRIFEIIAVIFCIMPILIVIAKA